MKKFLLSLGAAVLAVFQGVAYDFMEGGLAFNKLTDNTVEVTRINDDPSTDPIGGNFVSLYIEEVYRIPETVTHDGTVYTVTQIGDHAFYAADKVMEVYLTDKVTTLGLFAFQGCVALEKLEMPGMVSIKGYAFGGCYSLHEIRLPETMTDLIGSAFAGRDPATKKAPLRKLIFDCDPGVFSNKPFGSTRYVFDDVEEVVITAKVPAVTNSIPFGFDGLQTLTFEESPDVLDVGNFPFGSCRAKCLNIYRPLTAPKPSWMTLQSYYVDREEIHLGDFAPFEIGAPDDKIIASCTLYVHFNQLDAYKAHEQWGKFNIVMEPGSDIPAPDITYGYNFTIDKENMTAEIIAAGDVVDPYIGEHNIPERIRVGGKWYTVTSIGYQAFFNSGVTSVSLPSTITCIRQSAFNFCEELAEVRLNDGLTEMNWDAFANTPKLRSITIPGSLKTVPYNAFGNSGLESVVISDGVETVEAAFTGCGNLTAVSLPGTLTKLDGSFGNCRALKSISLPSSLREIGWFTFAATGIESLEIPEGLEKLDMQTLGMMNGDHNRDYTLRKVIFPATLDEVYGKTLNNRCGITELVFNGDGSAITVKETYTDFLEKTVLETLFLNRTFINEAGTDVTSAVIGSKSTLRNITFGGGMTTTPALTGCTAISDITVLNPVPPVAGEFAPEVYANAILTVPSGSSAAYRTAEVWKNFVHITDGAPVSTIDISKIRYTVGSGDNLCPVILRFANDRRLDNFVWGFRSTDAKTDPAAVIDAIAAADKRLHVTVNTDGAITSVAVDLNNDGVIDSRDIKADGEWTAAISAMASDELTSVISLTCGADILEAPYNFYMPDPAETGVYIPEAMTVRLSDDGFVLPVLVQTPGGKLDISTNWQASSSNTSYIQDRTLIVTPYTLIDDTYNAVPALTGATGVTYVRYRPRKAGESSYLESNYMTLTVEAPEIPMTSISVTPREIETALNREIPFSYTFEPENATYTAVRVTSGNEQAVTWNVSAGLRSTSKAGTAVVTVASLCDPDVMTEMTVTSRLMNPVTNVSFGHADADGVISVPVRRLVDLRPTVEPADADIPYVSITLSDNGVSKDDMTCSIYQVQWKDLDGNPSSFYELSGHRPTGGNPARLIVKSNDGAYSREFTVNVTEADRTPLENGYVDGTIILNEEWFGHSNGGLNYITEDDNFIYQAYEKENPGMSFGCTSQYGTIYAGKLIVASKKAGDNGDPLPGGGRLVIADAKTLRRLGSLDDLTWNGVSAGECHAVAGATPDKIYVSTSDGIFVVNISDPARPAVTGRVGKKNSSDLYNGSAGDMVNAGKYVFAMMQNTGILVIDTETDCAVTIADQYVQGVTQTADGTVWYATVGNNGTSRFVGIDPETFEEIENVTMPGEVGIVSCSWGAWRSTAFCGSPKTNDLWFVTGAAEAMGGASGDYYRYHVGDDPAGIRPFFSLDDVTGINGFGEEVPMMTYGTPRYDDRNDRLIVMTGRKDAISGQYRDHWVHYVDGTDGKITKSLHLDPYYWFQSLPIFPDKYPAEINLEDIVIYTDDDPAEIDLSEVVTDRDNNDHNINIALEGNGDGAVAGIALDGRNLTVTPVSDGNMSFTLVAESNGVETRKTVSVNVIDNSGVNGVKNDRFSVRTAGRRVFVDGAAGRTLSIYNTAGLHIATFGIDTDSYVVGLDVVPGVYIAEIDGVVTKVVLR